MLRFLLVQLEIFMPFMLCFLLERFQVSLRNFSWNFLRDSPARISPGIFILAPSQIFFFLRNQKFSKNSSTDSSRIRQIPSGIALRIYSGIPLRSSPRVSLGIHPGIPQEGLLGISLANLPTEIRYCSEDFSRDSFKNIYRPFIEIPLVIVMGCSTVSFFVTVVIDHVCVIDTHGMFSTQKT